MILVNVRFPALNCSYDFKLSEMTEIARLMEDITEMIAQKERCGLDKGEDFYLLCNARTGRIFRRNTTLAENGISSGDTLLLV